MSGKIAIEKLNPHPKNTFYFTDVEGEKFEEIKGSIDTYGIRDPLKVTTSYTIISGHQRYRIANELGFTDVPVQIEDADEWQAEYMLIAENVERRGQAETDAIKKSRIASFLKEYWGVKNHRPKGGQNVQVKTTEDIAETIGESRKQTQRLLKLNDLIPPLQELVSEGKLGTTAAEQLAYLSEGVQRALFDKLGEKIGESTVEEQRKMRKDIEDLTKQKHEEIKKLQRRIEQLEGGEEKTELEKRISEVEKEKTDIAMELIDAKKREEQRIKELQQKADQERLKLQEEKKKQQDRLKEKEIEIREYETHVEELLDKLEKYSIEIDEQGLSEKAIQLMSSQVELIEKCNGLSELIVMLTFDVPYDLPQSSQEVYKQSLRKIADVANEAYDRFIPEVSEVYENKTIIEGEIING